ncbi:MFS transporter [Nonomuraea sp. NPDC050556]|uniref:MFS transporter n=1 Tax=Nonomuraea sp. NPDC050556 TaxID=3364369 RepID=UPI003794441A
MTDHTVGEAGSSSAWKKDFRLLWSGSALSQFGTSNAMLSASLLALSLTQSPVVAGWVAAAGTLPRILLYLPVGVIVDRVDRRKVMITSVAGQAALAILMVTGVLFSGGSTILLVLTAAAQGVCVVFYNTAETTVVPRLVPRDSLPHAMSRNEARNHGAALLGRPFGGLLFGLHHGLPFLIDAVSSTLSAILLLRIRKDAFKPPARKHALRMRTMVRQLRVGIAFLRRDVFLVCVLFVCALANFFFQTIGLVLVLLTHEKGLPTWVTGCLLAATGLGGVLGSLTTSRLRNMNPNRVIVRCVWSWLALCVILAAGDQTSLAHVAVVLPLAWGGIGFVGAYINVALALYQAVRVPQNMLGRVVSVSRFVSGGAVPLGALASGYVVAELGAKFAVIGVALVIGVLTLIISSTIALERLPLIDFGGQPDRSDSREYLVAQLPQSPLEALLYRFWLFPRARQHSAIGGPRHRIAQGLQSLVTRARTPWAQPFQRAFRLPQVYEHLADLARKSRAVEAGRTFLTHLEDEAHRQAELHHGRRRALVRKSKLSLAGVLSLFRTLFRRRQPAVPGPEPFGDDAPSRAGQRGEDGAPPADECHQGGGVDQDSPERCLAAST